MPETIDYSWEAIKVAREWAEGKRSHNNAFLQVSGASANGIVRVQALAAVAVADAAEVVKYSALAQALIAKEAAFRSR